MRLLLALSMLGAVMYVCGLDNAKQTDSQPPPPVANKSTPAKLDKEALKAELLEIEDDMTNAAMNGDITLLVKNTTDDFKLTGVDGKVQNKNEALADVKKEKTIRNFSITEPDLMSYSEDSAVMAYTLNVTLKTGQSGKARVTDSFVKRDGRWLIRSEQQTMIRK
jgi:hypothetical protein